MDSQLLLEFNYKSMLTRYMQVVANTEGIHFIDECSTVDRSDGLQFKKEEIEEMYRLFDEEPLKPDNLPKPIWPVWDAETNSYKI